MPSDAGRTAVGCLVCSKISRRATKEGAVNDTFRMEVRERALEGIVGGLDMEITTDILEARKRDRFEIPYQLYAATNVREGWESIDYLKERAICNAEQTTDKLEIRENHA